MEFKYVEKAQSVITAFLYTGNAYDTTIDEFAYLMGYEIDREADDSGQINIHFISWNTGRYETSLIYNRYVIFEHEDGYWHFKAHMQKDDFESTYEAVQ